MSTKYAALLSLPLSGFDSSDRDDALSSLKATIPSTDTTVLPFNLPSFKIGTLDGLVQQADDLAKLEANCQNVVAKVADSLRSVLSNDENRLAQYKMVNDKPTDQYLSSFSWNKIRYRADKPLSELIDTLQKVRRHHILQNQIGPPLESRDSLLTSCPVFRSLSMLTMTSSPSLTSTTRSRQTSPLCSVSRPETLAPSPSRLSWTHRY
jgi:hypothetical protein